MFQEKSVLAIIPARGGSKGLPGKNIKELCGKPLIAWTIEKALKSRHLDEVMFSTDSEEIAKVAAEHGANVPFLRPLELATDTASSVDVVNHALDYYQKLGRTFDYFVLLEPTSPLREETDIDLMLEKLILQSEEYDSIISLGEVHEHPSIMKKIEEKSFSPFCSELEMKSRRQDNEPAYFPYGVAYIVKTETFQKEQSFYTDRCTYFLIQRYQCYEIDDIYDFLAIESVMKYKWEINE